MCYCGCLYENYYGECTCNGRFPWDGECQRRKRDEEEDERMEAEVPQPEDEGDEDA